MPSQQVILVNSSRLLRELVRRVIERGAGFEVITELGDILELPSAVMKTDAEWVFLILSPNQEIPESLKVSLFLKCPTMRIVGLWVDSGRVSINGLGYEQKDFTEVTLSAFMRLLRQELHALQNAYDGSQEE
jgi:hypothetical protein